MAVSGHDLRQSLEAAIAAKYSALWGSVPLSLPLEDRSLTLYPTPYRWLGGDLAPLAYKRSIQITSRKTRTLSSVEYAEREIPLAQGILVKAVDDMSLAAA